MKRQAGLRVAGIEGPYEKYVAPRRAPVEVEVEDEEELAL